MSRLRTIVCFGMAVMFLLFVSVQFNDVDAAVWVLAYGLAAIVCIACTRPSLVRFVRLITLPAMMGYSLWALVLARQTSGHWWDGEIEREVGGLVVTALSMGLMNFFSRSASRFS